MLSLQISNGFPGELQILHPIVVGVKRTPYPKKEGLWSWVYHIKWMCPQMRFLNTSPRSLVRWYESNSVSAAFWRSPILWDTQILWYCHTISCKIIYIYIPMICPCDSHNMLQWYCHGWHLQNLQILGPRPDPPQCQVSFVPQALGAFHPCANLRLLVQQFKQMTLEQAPGINHQVMIESWWSIQSV